MHFFCFRTFAHARTFAQNAFFSFLHVCTFCTFAQKHIFLLFRTFARFARLHICTKTHFFHFSHFCTFARKCIFAHLHIFLARTKSVPNYIFIKGPPSPRVRFPRAPGRSHVWCAGLAHNLKPYTHTFFHFPTRFILFRTQTQTQTRVCGRVAGGSGAEGVDLYEKQPFSHLNARSLIGGGPPQFLGIS